MLNLKKNFFDNPIVAFIMIFPFVQVNAYLTKSLQIGFVALDFVIATLIYISFYRKFSHVGTWSVLFSVTIIVSTFFSNYDCVGYSLFYAIKMTAFFMIFDMYLSQRKYVILTILENYISALFLVNLFFQIWNQGYWGYTASKNYMNFFDSDNGLPFYVFVLIALIIFRSEYGRIGKIEIVRIVIAYLNLIKAWCASGLIATTICLILIVCFSNNNLIKKKLNLKIVVLFFAIIHLFLIYGGSLINILDGFVMNIFNKSITHSRLSVWRVAVQNIMKHPILGYGTAKTGRRTINFSNGKYWYSHNFILEYLVQGGVIFLIVYLLLIVAVVKKNKNRRRHQLLLTFVFIGLHIAFLTEGTITDPIPYLIYILMYFAGDKNTFELGGI